MSGSWRGIGMPGCSASAARGSISSRNDRACAVRGTALAFLAMDKSEIAQIFEEIAVLLELKGENPFKARAYTVGARALDSFDGDLKKLVAEDRLGELPGVGEALRQKIIDLMKTGRLEYYEKLRDSVPAGLLAMIEIPALGPKKIKVLHEKLGISTVAELEAACQAHKVRALTGFGPKTEEKILAGIGQARTYADLVIYSEAWAQAEEIREALRADEFISQLSVAGSLRRGFEIVRNLNFVASSRKPAEVVDYFLALPWIDKIVERSAGGATVLLKSGLGADLRVVSEKDYARALHDRTGSREHNAAMRERAKSLGKKIENIAYHTEEELFGALELQYIPPELRENMGEIEAAAKREIPRLIEWTQLRGTFHCHTNWSDGKNTLAEMAAEAQEIGLEYLGIADHSKSSIQANGLNEIRVGQQIAEIAKLNAKMEGFHIFAGGEVDILKDGRLDFSDDVLARLDYVVASVHNAMNLDEKEMTNRVIRAMENEHVTILGHSTGRLLLTREPYKINLERIIDCAARTGTWIELNCSSWRMDMDWRWWHIARDKGVKCVINPDAHRIAQFATLRHGVTMARKGWLRRGDVMNTLSLAEIRKVLR
jgi:DNA polymerase (family 10)